MSKFESIRDMVRANRQARMFADLLQDADTEKDELYLELYKGVITRYATGQMFLADSLVAALRRTTHPSEQATAFADLLGEKEIPLTVRNGVITCYGTHREFAVDRIVAALRALA